MEVKQVQRSTKNIMAKSQVCNKVWKGGRENFVHPVFSQKHSSETEDGIGRDSLQKDSTFRPGCSLPVNGFNCLVT